jgi:hypothetical protein
MVTVGGSVVIIGAGETRLRVADLKTEEMGEGTIPFLASCFNRISPPIEGSVQGRTLGDGGSEYGTGFAEAVFGAYELAIQRFSFGFLDTLRAKVVARMTFDVRAKVGCRMTIKVGRCCHGLIFQQTEGAHTAYQSKGANDKS